MNLLFQLIFDIEVLQKGYYLSYFQPPITIFQHSPLQRKDLRILFYEIIQQIGHSFCEFVNDSEHLSLFLQPIISNPFDVTLQLKNLQFLWNTCLQVQQHIRITQVTNNEFVFFDFPYKLQQWNQFLEENCKKIKVVIQQNESLQSKHSFQTQVLQSQFENHIYCVIKELTIRYNHLLQTNSILSKEELQNCVNQVIQHLQHRITSLQLLLTQHSTIQEETITLEKSNKQNTKQETNIPFDSKAFLNTTVEPIVFQEEKAEESVTIDSTFIREILMKPTDVYMTTPSLEIPYSNTRQWNTPSQLFSLPIPTQNKTTPVFLEGEADEEEEINKETQHRSKPSFLMELEGVLKQKLQSKVFNVIERQIN